MAQDEPPSSKEYLSGRAVPLNPVLKIEKLLGINQPKWVGRNGLYNYVNEALSACVKRYKKHDRFYWSYTVWNTKDPTRIIVKSEARYTSGAHARYCAADLIEKFLDQGYGLE